MRKAIIGLICLNLVLAGGFVYAWARRSTVTASPEVTAATAETALPPVAVRKNSTPISKPRFRPVSQPAEPASGWHTLASNDLKQFVTNLRGVHCPEQTIRELVLAEVNRRYGPLERGLKARPEDVPPWEMAASFDRKSAEGKLRQLLEEKRSLLKDLIGSDAPIEAPPRLAGRNIERFESAYKNLPTEKQDQVRAIQEQYWSQSDAIKDRTIGFLEPEDREEFVRIKAERRAELLKVMTPGEFEGYELATSTTGNFLRSKMNGFEAKEDELRQLLNFTQPLEEEYSLSRKSPDPENKEFMARRTAAEQAVENQIKSVLGDERYAEYQRMQDSAYRDIVKVGKDAGLPPESIVQVYDAQKAMRSEADRIMRDTAVPPEQRMQTLQAMQAQAQQNFQTLFGEKSPEILARLGGNAMIDQSAMKRYGLIPNEKPVDAPPTRGTGRRGRGAR